VCERKRKKKECEERVEGWERVVVGVAGDVEAVVGR
jgi:hypothetical protein